MLSIWQQSKFFFIPKLPLVTVGSIGSCGISFFVMYINYQLSVMLIIMSSVQVAGMDSGCYGVLCIGKPNLIQQNFIHLQLKTTWDGK